MQTRLKPLLIIAAVALMLFGPAQSLAQGFSELGTDATGFTNPQPGKRFIFPRDHASHNEYRIEWWYLTANLRDAAGNHYGIQWTLFRSALKPEPGTQFSPSQVWFAHSAVTTRNAHHAAETIARGGLGTAGVSSKPFKAWINGWGMRTAAGDTAADSLSNLHVNASGRDFSYVIKLNSDGPLVFHGNDGYSIKSETGQASYYYSQPFYEARGKIELPAGPVEVSGKAWLDREWSSQPLSANQTGWDWISLHLDSGAKLMGFQLRSKDESAFRSGTWIGPDGSSHALFGNDISMEPIERTVVARRNISTRWRVRVPDQNLDLTIEAINPKAWMNLSISYWEGPVAISGTHTGVGYLEMTGYSEDTANQSARR